MQVLNFPSETIGCFVLLSPGEKFLNLQGKKFSLTANRAPVLGARDSESWLLISIFMNIINMVSNKCQCTLQ